MADQRIIDRMVTGIAASSWSKTLAIESEEATVPTCFSKIGLSSKLLTKLVIEFTIKKKNIAPITLCLLNNCPKDIAEKKSK